MKPQQKFCEAREHLRVLVEIWMPALSPPALQSSLHMHGTGSEKIEELLLWKLLPARRKTISDCKFIFAIRPQAWTCAN